MHCSFNSLAAKIKQVTQKDFKNQFKTVFLWWPVGYINLLCLNSLTTNVKNKQILLLRNVWSWTELTSTNTTQSNVYRQKYRKWWESVPEVKRGLKPVIGEYCGERCGCCKSDMLAKMYDTNKQCATAEHLNKSKTYKQDQQSRLAQRVKKVENC